MSATRRRPVGDGDGHLPNDLLIDGDAVLSIDMPKHGSLRSRRGVDLWERLTGVNSELLHHHTGTVSLRWRVVNELNGPNRKRIVESGNECDPHSLMTECSPAMSSASPIFDQYREKFEARPPNLANQIHDDEISDLRAGIEVQSFPVAPMPTEVSLGQDFSDLTKKYLWLVGLSDIPFARENGDLGKLTKRGYLAHTNLSGGDLAHCGGELWCAGPNRLLVNGKSGRYRPRTASELDEIVTCFRLAGYLVASSGWDVENNVPASMLPRVLEWK